LDFKFRNDLSDRSQAIFVDIDEYFTIDVAKLEAHITPQTKAIIPVHIHGQMCNMEAIMEMQTDIIFP
jgi:dTDP-4-amino-4,6-dideoxygalactose transaminase